MTQFSKLACLAVVASVLAACATTPPDLPTPPAKKLDAKTQLENGKK